MRGHLGVKEVRTSVGPTREHTGTVWGPEIKELGVRRKGREGQIIMVCWKDNFGKCWVGRTNNNKGKGGVEEIGECLILCNENYKHSLLSARYITTPKLTHHSFAQLSYNRTLTCFASKWK